MPLGKPLTSDIARVEPDKITIHGLDLSRDIIGKLNLGDMAFLEIKKRLPTPQESAMFNAISVTLVEHGMSAAAIVARMTYAGAPEAMQAAVAAGLCGIGGGMHSGLASEQRKAGGMENVARMLQEALPDPKANVDLDALARAVVESHAQSQNIPGIGHHFHVRADPRTARLFEVARQNGFDGPYVKLIQLIAKRAEESYGKVLPINSPGTIGSIASELGMPWQIVRGIGVIARTIGLVGHILEEMHAPVSGEIQRRAAEEAQAPLRSA